MVLVTMVVRVEPVEQQQQPHTAFPRRVRGEVHRQLQLQLREQSVR